MPRRKTNKEWSGWDVGETIYEDSGKMMENDSSQSGLGEDWMGPTKDNK